MRQGVVPNNGDTAQLLSRRRRGRVLTNELLLLMVQSLELSPQLDKTKCSIRSKRDLGAMPQEAKLRRLGQPLVYIVRLTNILL